MTELSGPAAAVVTRPGIASAGPYPIERSEAAAPDDGAPGLPGATALATPAQPAAAKQGLLRHMPQLDALRAVAVFCVFFHHWWFIAARNYFPWGRFGVRLFFVLSGFLITGILLRCRAIADAGEESRPFTLRRFYIRRFLRLFPPYYLLLAVAFLAGAETIRQSIGWHLGYLSNFYFVGQGAQKGPAAHLWSLAVEEQFYLVWPWLILFLPRRWLVPAVLVTGGLAPAWRLAGVLLHWKYTTITLPTLASLDALAVGALLGLFADPAASFAARPGTVGPTAAWDRLCRVGLWVGIPATLVAAVAQYKLKRQLGAGVEVFGDVAQSLFAVWLVGRAATGFGGAAGRVLTARPLLYLGKISYALYLYHLFCPLLVLPLLAWLGITLTDTAHPHLYFATMVIAAVLVATVSWYLVESPISRLKAFAGYRRAKPAGPATHQAVPAPGLTPSLAPAQAR